MKRIKGLTSLLTPAMLMGMLAVSCTNNLNDMGGNQSQLKGGVVHTPDAVVWSGNQTFGNTFTGTRSQGYTADVYSNNYPAPKTRAFDDVTFETIKTKDIDRASEKEYVDGQLPEKGLHLDDPKFSHLDGDFIFYASKDVEIEMYPIDLGTSRWNHYLGLFYYDTTGEYHEVILWDEINNNVLTENVQENGEWIQENEYWGHYEQINVTYSIGRKINMPQGYAFGFYWGADLDLVDDGEYKKDKNDKYVVYTTAGMNPESKVRENEQFTDKTSKIHAVTWTGNGKTYLGLEDWDDFDYQDMVFTVTPELETIDEGDFKPGQTPDPKCPNKDKSVGTGVGCTHDDVTHEWDKEKQKWVCPQCKEEGQDTECNPCPEHFGDDCGHSGNHHDPETGICDECQKGETCNPNDSSEGDNTCDHCPHPKHPGEPCPIPGCDAPECHPLPGQPNNPTQKPSNNEVEINLSILDIHNLPNGSPKYDIADLVSKLSIHVRYPHDVEVILPVPQSIYCDQDDLYILKTHDVGEYTYGGEKNELTYVIGGYEIGEDGKPVKNTAGELVTKEWRVTLGIEFVPANNDYLTNKERTVKDKDGVKDIQAGGYIRVYTDGIDKKLIDFLKYHYGDGINFEVYNYYNRGTQYTTGSYPEISYECLQYNFLSHSFVNFDWNEEGEKVLPDFYINAFNKVNLLPTKGDCYTWIIGDVHADNGVYQAGGSINESASGVTWTLNGGQKAAFANPYQGTHFNNSDLNWIYTLKAIGGEDSSDMPDAIWPFNDGTSLWQYYRFGGSDTWNWGGLSNSNNN